MRRQLLIISWIGFIAYLMVGCSQPTTPPPTPGPKAPASITCFTFYRSSVTVSNEQQANIILTFQDEQKEVEYPDLMFHAQLFRETWKDAGSLKVWVTLPGDKHELMAVLYQFLEMPYTDAYSMSGGHGFTGLHYVYNPTSQAELQFWCEAK